MPSFAFVARDQAGKSVSGVRAATTREEVIGRLRAENLVVTSVAGEGEGAGAHRDLLAEWRANLFMGRVKCGDLLVFTRQLSAMLKAGVALTDALHTIAHSMGSPRLHDVLLEVRGDVQRGRTFTDALRKHPSVFDSLFISIVHAGESSGSLAQNIARLSAYLDRKEKFRRKLRSATAYPKFVLGFFTVLTSVIFLVLIPKFKSLFDDFHAKLPPLTQAMMDASLFLRHFWFVWAPLLIAGGVGVAYFARTPTGKVFFDRYVLRIPFFGKLFLEAAVARLSMTLSTLLSNGIPLTDALQIATATLNNSILEEGCRGARKEVMTGHSLAESLSRVTELPKLLPRMVRVGEESGTLSGMLEDVAAYYDQEVDHALSRITAVIEPILICGMGVVVLITVIAIYLPIFSLGQTMRGG